MLLSLMVLQGLVAALLFYTLVGQHQKKPLWNLLAPDVAGVKNHSGVDGHSVPVPHFGVVLLRDDWEALAERVKAANIEFVIEPYIRFKGKPGEQGTMFFYDYCGNALEFKTFNDDSQIFAT